MPEVPLTPWLRAELTRRAALAAPLEACGLISRASPTPGYPSGRISLWEAENAAEEPETSFLIAPQSQFDILEQIKRQGQELVGIYHSHPRSAPDLSERDREIAKLWPGLVWVIVGTVVDYEAWGMIDDPTGEEESLPAYRARRRVEFWAGVP